MAVSAAPGVRTYHGLSVPEVQAHLETDAHHGLPAAEAAARLERHGLNRLPETKRAGLVVRAARQFHHPLIYILIAGGVITAALGEFVDSAVIFGVVLINAVVGYIQEAKAESALAALRSMVRTPAKVIRDGQRRIVPSEELALGDLVVLDEGDRVPADLRLTRSAELRIDESALTGESVPVAKRESALPDDVPVADRNNMAYSGTLVTTGSGNGIVCAVGAATEIGEIHRLVGTAGRIATPLTEKLARFSRLLTVAILVLAAATFAVGLLRGQAFVEMFTAAIALAVAAIPEGLPAAVTITLAIGVARMARRRAVIRRLPAAETLGSTTVVCTDKTGTLTENQMTVRVLWTPRARYEITGSGYAPGGAVLGDTREPADPDADHALRWSLLAGAACNDAALHLRDGRWTVVGDPTEGAMLVAAAKAGFTRTRVEHLLPRAATIPFSSERRYMASLHTVIEDGRPAGCMVLAKGAVERMTDLCGAQMDTDGAIEPLDRATVLSAAHELASQGMRVLATAVRPVPQGLSAEDFDEPDLAGELVLTGLHVMLDPPRETSAAAVEACRTAGIDVKMITGDHMSTAAAIARRVGILDGDEHAAVLTGRELAAMSPERLRAVIDQVRVFARVSPEQKLRLVEALQARGHVVAMTGDGVNDAPALRQAGIGVAMGATGTEVAKDAADMVLTDDEFATIEAAVEEGRGVFDNLTKFIAWTLPTNFGQSLVILIAIALGVTLPIMPTQILWINMTTAVALGLMLAFEPKEAGIMTRPPRDPEQAILTRALMERILMVSTLLVAGGWWLFQWELAQGASLAEARTAAVNLFVVIQTFYLFSCRSLTRSAWRLGLFSNRWIVAGVSVQALAQLSFTYLPGMNAVFHTAPIGPDVWVRIVGIAALASAVVAVDKRLRGRRS